MAWTSSLALKQLVIILARLSTGWARLCYVCDNDTPIGSCDDYENVLPTEICSGRCFLRSHSFTPGVFSRGCTEDFRQLPNTGCYIYPNSTWCLCDENLCNFGPIEPENFEDLHTRMTKRSIESKPGLRVVRDTHGQFDKTLPNPFIHGAQTGSFDENEEYAGKIPRDPHDDRLRAMKNLGVFGMKNSSNLEGKFAIIGEGKLVTNQHTAPMLMGVIPPIDKYSLHGNTRGNREPRSGSIFTRDGKIVHRGNNDEDWSNGDRYRDEWRSKEQKNKWNTDDSEEDWNLKKQTKQRKKEDWQSKKNTNPWNKDSTRKDWQSNKQSNTWTSKQRRKMTKSPTTVPSTSRSIFRNDGRMNHHGTDDKDYGNFDSSSREFESKEYESWELEASVEVDDSVWDWGLDENVKKQGNVDSQSIFPPSNFSDDSPKSKSEKMNNKDRKLATTKVPPGILDQTSRNPATTNKVNKNPDLEDTENASKEEIVIGYKMENGVLKKVTKLVEKSANSTTDKNHAAKKNKVTPIKPKSSHPKQIPVIKQNQHQAVKKVNEAKPGKGAITELVLRKDVPLLQNKNATTNSTKAYRSGPKLSKTDGLTGLSGTAQQQLSVAWLVLVTFLAAAI